MQVERLTQRWVVHVGNPELRVNLAVSSLSITPVGAEKRGDDPDCNDRYKEYPVLSGNGQNQAK